MKNGTHVHCPFHNVPFVAVWELSVPQAFNVELWVDVRGWKGGTEVTRSIRAPLENIVDSPLYSQTVGRKVNYDVNLLHFVIATSSKMRHHSTLDSGDWSLRCRIVFLLLTCGRQGGD